MLGARHAFFFGALGASALIAGAASAQSCVEPPLGLLAWWPGDGDSVDVHASRLHGVALNGAGYGDGLVGEAFVLDGVGGGRDDRVDLPPHALSGREDLTVEMWVQTTDDQGAFLSGAGAGSDAFNNEMLLFQGITGIQAALRQQGTGVIPASVNDGAWHHLAYVRSNDVGILYVDGVPVDARSVPTEPLEIGPGGLMIGQEQDCLGGCLDAEQALDGRVDELSIYGRALSEGEIFAIFDAREAGKCKPASAGDLHQRIADLEAEVHDLLAEIEGLEADLAAPPGRRCGYRRGPWTVGGNERGRASFLRCEDHPRVAGCPRGGSHCEDG